MKILLDVKNLKVTDVRNQEEIVHGISFSLKENACLGIVGESGSGKSMVTKAILGLTHDWLISEGSAKFNVNEKELNLLQTKESDLRKIRGKQICMILQDGMSAFDPLGKIGDQMAETFMENQNLTKKQGLLQGREALKSMNIYNPEDVIKKYPHQLSGGMLQRCMIATALALNPNIIVADEPTTALDSINQRQVVEEFKKIREKTGTALIFISHDLGVVKHLSEELLVMKDGYGVEYGNTEDIFRNPRELYTQYLIESRVKMTNSFKKAMYKGSANGKSS